ncbi:hypothetical protein EUAN_02410 [Andreesenia angusta]|uniref:N-acetyltransferase domain-containing protein n=1 Tax=Andreesenia angusta TaxID=39480 RepID=A0A1S1VAW0_9FIRM|nr:hypothetical protein [Andreesenia angusta]OHW63377.1 hypothetical protein EUAN_02410 [Andreesenia angusta]
MLQIPSNLSNRKIKDFDGFSAKINGEVITEIPAILIGQIGKNDSYRSEISGKDLMQYCMNMVLNGQTYLGGRVVMLECKEVPFLIELYESFGFVKIEKDYKKDELLQFIRILKEDELFEKESI